jgi:type II secretion system protein H
MKSACKTRGFTLLELVLVMVIICTALAMASPSLRGWSRGSALRDAGNQLLAITRWAHTQAVATAQVHRLSIDSGAGKYVVKVQEGEEFVGAGSEFGRDFALPAGYRIDAKDAGGQAIEHVDFFPTGRTEAARIRITSSDGSQIELQCQGPTEAFQLAQELSQ